MPIDELLAAAFAPRGMAPRAPAQRKPFDAGLLSDARITCMYQHIWQYIWIGVLLYEVPSEPPLLLRPWGAGPGTADRHHRFSQLTALPIDPSNPRFVAAAQGAYQG